MRLVAWVLKLGFFLLVLWFALKNTTPVPVRVTSTMSWEHVPLILVMLVCIGVGALLGALALALPIYRMSWMRLCAASRPVFRRRASDTS